MIFNNDDEIVFVCNGNFKYICKDNNLPFAALRKSYAKNGTRIYQSKRSIKDCLRNNTTQFIVNMMWDDCETLVGASRGSALGYLSNYLLGITQIDPCLYPLVKPWRHLSVKRPDLPKK